MTHLTPRATIHATFLTLWFTAALLQAQPYGPPDRGAPGDALIQGYLAAETAKLAARYDADIASRDAWESKRRQYLEEYFYMLGLSPRPEKTPLQPTITGSLRGQGYVVDMIHYQSRPGLYVTGNLYRPAEAKPDQKFPAIFYVCGHSHRGRNGNKVAYQSHGIWFARHGYLCLVVDSLQLGEIAAFHHGTYNLNRWWWLARGYTPAGVEAWNGIRGIDYLTSRPDVDPTRIAVTGISGGGASTFWIAAADERVRVAVPVSGMADLESYVPNRVINGHCDCMFLHNAFGWPWTRIANLVAPRPMLFINSDNDPIFPMDANERIIRRLERLYSHYGASDQVDAVVSVGGHAYRKDIRQAVYRFINAHLKGDARPIDDSEIDVVSEGSQPGPYPIAPEKLRVFPTDADIPKGQRNTTIDEHFVPVAKPAPPKPGQYDAWKRSLLKELRRVSFGSFPDVIPPAKPLANDKGGPRLETEPGIEITLTVKGSKALEEAETIALRIRLADGESLPGVNVRSGVASGQVEVVCDPRGVGATRWTMKNPPNYVERSHVLLGRTVDTGRIRDVIATAKYLRQRAEAKGRRVRLTLVGTGKAGVLAAYAAVLEDVADEVVVHEPPASHHAANAPVLLNVLRVCDIPEVLGMVAPRRLTLVGAPSNAVERVGAAYSAAETREALRVVD